MPTPDRKPVTLRLGPVQANVVIDALTAYGCDIGAEVGAGEPDAVRASNILQNVRDDISRQLRRAGRKANW